MTTTAIATTTAPATPAAPAAKITRTTLVNALFAEARGLILDDVPTARLPRITAAGVEAVYRLATRREPLTGWLVTKIRMWLDVGEFPAHTRRRRVLNGLAKFLPGVPDRVKSREAWFCPRTILANLEETGHAASVAEAAGVYALLMVRRA
jgi:hypothetical protein